MANARLPDVQTWIRPKRERWLELRKTCLTSTEMCGVAGMPKYGMTRFKIYHLKKDLTPDDFVPTDRTDAGTFMEPAIAQWGMKKTALTFLRHADFQIRGSIGASYDYRVAMLSTEHNDWLVEIKNVDGLIYRQQWADGAIPHQIEIQVQSQLYVSQRPGCILLVCVGGNELHVHYIPRDDEFGYALADLAATFWTEIQAGIVPAHRADDLGLITQLYRTSDPDSTLDATEDMELTRQLSFYDECRELIKFHKAQMDLIKADVLVQIGDNSRVFAADGWNLNSGHTKDNPGKVITEAMVGQTIGARNGHRQFLLTRQQETEFK